MYKGFQTPPTFIPDQAAQTPRPPYETPITNSNVLGYELSRYRNQLSTDLARYVRMNEISGAVNRNY
jgi:hypothetical protein